MQQRQKQEQQEQQQQQQQQQQKQALDNELNLCQAERQLCKEIKNLCTKKLQQEGQSTQEAEKECIKVSELCKQQQQTKSNLRDVLQNVNNVRAMSISMKAVLRGREESLDRKIETQIAVGEKNEAYRSEQTQVTMKLSLKTPALRKPFEAEIHANGKIQRPSNKWEVDEILN